MIIPFKNISKIFVPVIKKLVFHIPHLRIFSSTEYGQTRYFLFNLIHNFSGVKVITYYNEKVSELFSVQVQSDHWSGGRQNPMKCVDIN